MKTKRKNPHTKRKQPDLFEGGETAEFIPLEELDDEQLRALSLDAFTPEELEVVDEEILIDIVKRDKPAMSSIDGERWEAMPRDVRDEVKKHDPEVQNRDALKEALVEGIEKIYRQQVEPDEHYCLGDGTQDELANHLGERADHLLEDFETDWDRSYRRGSSPAADLLEEMLAAGWDEDEARRAIDEAMQDVDNWEGSMGDEYYSAGPGAYKASCSNYGLQLADDYLIELDESLEGTPESRWRELSREQGGGRKLEIEIGDLCKLLDDDDLEDALDDIHRATDEAWKPSQHSRQRVNENSLTVDRLRSTNWTIERDYEAYAYVDWVPDWDKIRAAVLDLDVPDAKALPAKEIKWLDQGERVVYKWPDGFFVLWLAPDEMRAEGDELNFCIGKEQYGYVKSVVRGDGAAYSLRTPSGRPKLTLFLEWSKTMIPTLGEEPEAGSVGEVSQVKGKSNRLPGWDLHKAGEGKIKQDEVAKIVEFVAGYLKFDPTRVGDLRPALQEIQVQAFEGDPWAVKLLDKMNSFFEYPVMVPASAVDVFGARRRPRENPEHTHDCGEHGCVAEGFCRPYKRRR